MIQSIYVYICLLHLFCNSYFAALVGNYDAGNVKPTNILMSFYECNSTNEKAIKCFIQDIDCIENTYNRLNKDNYEITLFIHGYIQRLERSAVPYLVSAYCSKNFSVFALLDWSQQASTGDIFKLTYQVSEIGKVVASTLNTLKNKGYDLQAWHLVGHSMGAHIAGCIGIYADFRFSHITGLDPAGLIFYTDAYKSCRMEPNVADSTDAFYTDSLGYAAVSDVGTINIYANTGTSPQPGCCSAKNIHDCSHIKALTWYADAVRNETKFQATKCDSCFSFLKFGTCEKNDRILFGPRVNKKASGNYCLRID